MRKRSPWISGSCSGCFFKAEDRQDHSGEPGPAISPVLLMLGRPPVTPGNGLGSEAACASLPCLFPPLPSSLPVGSGPGTEQSRSKRKARASQGSCAVTLCMKVMKVSVAARNTTLDEKPWKLWLFIELRMKSFILGLLPIAKAHNSETSPCHTNFKCYVLGNRWKRECKEAVKQPSPAW